MKKFKSKHLLTIDNLSSKEIEEVIDLTFEIKNNPHRYRKKLSGKTVALLFDKPSTRTRLSFQAAVNQLGGDTVFLRKEELQIKRGETLEDTAKMLSIYVDAVVIRTFSHKDLIEISKFSSVPIINGLTDFSHPCQALSDLYNIIEKKGSLKNLKISYIGDGNNVANSLLLICGKLGLEFWISTPENYKPNAEVFKKAKDYANKKNGRIIHITSPIEAAKNADVIYTDVWTSMGMEKEEEIRRKEFKNFVIDSKLVSYAKKDVIVMHCLPAHRGEEITSEVLDGSHSVVIQQAENRLHMQKAILLKII